MNRLVTEVLDRLVADIEAGKNPWKKSWKGGSGLPTNATTKRMYRGVNTLMLWIAEKDHGFSSSNWATYKQWAGAGQKVRGGEKGTAIVFYKVREVGEGDDARSIPMLRVSWVYNEAQLAGEAAEPSVAQPPSQEERHVQAQQWFDGTGAKLSVSINRQPSYMPGEDMICMPDADAFTSLDEFYSTLFHETSHWTGHKTRLARDMGGGYGSISYAREELVAEIAAAFMGAHFGIDTEKNNAAYLRNWLQKFDDKREAIFTAAKDAGRAFEFLTTPRQQQEAA